MINTNTASVSDLTALLVNASNLEVDEYNALFDRMEEAEDKVSVLAESNKSLLAQLSAAHTDNENIQAVINDLNHGAALITDNAEKHMQMLSNANRVREQAIDKLSKSETILALYKDLGTPKKIREKFKAYQNKAAGHQSDVTAHKVAVKEYRQQIQELIKAMESMKLTEMQSNMTTIWSEEQNHLLLFPAPLTMSVCGKEEQQLTLLFMDNSGCGKLIGIDEEGEPKVCSMPKGGLKPKAKTLRVAGEFLRKFKRQGWKLAKEDLALNLRN